MNDELFHVSVHPRKPAEKNSRDLDHVYDTSKGSQYQEYTEFDSHRPSPEPSPKQRDEQSEVGTEVRIAMGFEKEKILKDDDIIIIKQGHFGIMQSAIDSERQRSIDSNRSMPMDQKRTPDDDDNDDVDRKEETNEREEEDRNNSDRVTSAEPRDNLSDEDLAKTVQKCLRNQKLKTAEGFVLRYLDRWTGHVWTGLINQVCQGWSPDEIMTYFVHWMKIPVTKGWLSYSII
ncbi:hypothetical protein RFI_30742, partial [Reticulomyxa filosa]